MLSGFELYPRWVPLMKVLLLHCKWLHLRMARMTTSNGGPVSRRTGDVKIVSPISSFVLNTLTLEKSAFFLSLNA